MVKESLLISCSSSAQINHHVRDSSYRRCDINFSISFMAFYFIVCGGDAFAFSSSCAKDAYHRPTAGYINICAEVCKHPQHYCSIVTTLSLHSYLTLTVTHLMQELPDTIKFGENGDVLYNILLHELIHALGFSQERFSE